MNKIVDDVVHRILSGKKIDLVIEQAYKDNDLLIFTYGYSKDQFIDEVNALISYYGKVLG